jgi:hypothetical protein
VFFDVAGDEVSLGHFSSAFFDRDLVLQELLKRDANTYGKTEY